MNFFLKPKSVLLTGSTGQLGAAIKNALEGFGHNVTCPTRADLDLSSEKSVTEYCSFIRTLNIEILINNAGINNPENVDKLTSANWLNTLQTNLNAPFFISQACSENMKKNSGGKILNISSIFSKISKEKRTAYTVSKAGLDGLTRSLAVELGANNILVNSLLPGYIDSPLTHKNNTPEQLNTIVNQIPLLKMATPSQIAQVAMFLVSDLNMYVTGQTIVADGGFTLR